MMKQIISLLVLSVILIQGCATHYTDVTEPPKSKDAYSENKAMTEAIKMTAEADPAYTQNPTKHRILAAGSHVSGAIMGS